MAKSLFANASEDILAWTDWMDLCSEYTRYWEKMPGGITKKFKNHTKALQPTTADSVSCPLSNSSTGLLCTIQQDFLVAHLILQNKIQTGFDKLCRGHSLGLRHQEPSQNPVPAHSPIDSSSTPLEVGVTGNGEVTRETVHIVQPFLSCTTPELFCSLAGRERPTLANQRRDFFWEGKRSNGICLSCITVVQQPQQSLEVSMRLLLHDVIEVYSCVLELIHEVIQQIASCTGNRSKLQVVIQSIIPVVVLDAARELLDTNTNHPRKTTSRLVDGLDWLTSCAVVLIWYSDNIDVIKNIYKKFNTLIEIS
jgi:hypothetical protein